MLTLDDILKGMTETQKISLLSDFNVLYGDVPSVKSAKLSDLNKKQDFPAYESMISSWDKKLWEEVVYALVSEEENNQKANLFITPDLKCSANAYEAGLSEDSYLNGAFGTVMAHAVHEAGGACALSGFYCDEKDVKFLDREEDEQAVYNLFCKPFREVTEKEPCEAIISSLHHTCGGYVDTNIRLFEEAFSGKYGKEPLVVGEKLSPDVDFHTFLSYTVCIRESKSTMDRAVGRYKQFAHLRETGQLREKELQAALDCGIVIDPKTIDNATKKVIDFARRVNQREKGNQKQGEGKKPLGFKATAASIVLLKNKKLLPLAEGKKVAVIGECYKEFAKLPSLRVVATAGGYLREEDQNEIICEEAVKAAEEADVVVVFLSHVYSSDGSIRKLSLSANQQTMLDKLKATGKSMIGVLPANVPMDMSVDKMFTALLTAPLESKYCASALADVLTGKINPSGRLARSYYDDADVHYQMLCTERDRDKLRIGEFIGYRSYDLIQEKVRYPFGFGLSYTRFVYSNLRMSQNKIRFTVKNVGKEDGCETVQIYIGAPIFPYAKELKAFDKVSLKAGEKREVTFNLQDSWFSSYDESERAENIATGLYRIYVGASALDIRLRGVCFKKGVNRAKSERTHANYSLAMPSKKRGQAKTSIRRVKKAAWTGLFIMFVLFAGLGISLLATDKTLTSFYPMYILLGGIGLFVIVLIVEHICYQQKRKKLYAVSHTAARSVVSKARTPQEVFDQAFFVPPKEEESKGGKRNDEPTFFDRSYSIKDVCSDMRKFLAESGIGLSEKDSYRLLAAFVSSRILIFPCGDEKKIDGLFTALSEYFGGSIGMASMIEGVNTESVLERVTKADKFRQAIAMARYKCSFMHIFLYHQAKAKNLQNFVFAKKLQEFDALRSKYDEDNYYVIPPNLWTVVMLGEDERLEELPYEIARVSSVLDLDIQERSTSVKTPVKSPSFYQFDHLSERIREGTVLSEKLWKEVDRLEESFAPYSFRRVDNRTWIKMEKFTSAYLACGGGEADALDNAVATQFLVVLLTSINCSKLKNEEILTLLEEAFGTDNIDDCRSFIRNLLNYRYKEKQGSDTI